MRHAKKGRKLGTDASHTRAMLRSLAAALLANERIKTTEARAKEVRPLVDRIISWGKRGDVHARRLQQVEVEHVADVEGRHHPADAFPYSTARRRSPSSCAR